MACSASTGLIPTGASLTCTVDNTDATYIVISLTDFEDTEYLTEVDLYISPIYNPDTVTKSISSTERNPFIKIESYNGADLATIVDET